MLSSVLYQGLEDSLSTSSTSTAGIKLQSLTPKHTVSVNFLCQLPYISNVVFTVSLVEGTSLKAFSVQKLICGQSEFS